MNGISFPQQTTVYGKPPGWKDEDCYGLPVNQGFYLDSQGKKQPLLTSCWLFSPEELEKLSKTGKLYLSIVGFGMQPVSMSVDNPIPEDLQPGIEFHQKAREGKI